MNGRLEIGQSAIYFYCSLSFVSSMPLVIHCVIDGVIGCDTTGPESSVAMVSVPSNEVRQYIELQIEFYSSYGYFANLPTRLVCLPLRSISSHPCNCVGELDPSYK